ncbi:MAG: ImuA family protein, partial [Pararhodobacter sp.]
MSDAVPRPTIAALRARIVHLEGAETHAREVLPFGVDMLDRRLPQGGLAMGCLHEVAGGGGGAVDGAAAACFVAGIAARLPGPVLWCVTQADLFAPGLEQAGLSPDRVIYVDAGDETA